MNAGTQSCDKRDVSNAGSHVAWGSEKCRLMPHDDSRSRSGAICGDGNFPISCQRNKGQILSASTHLKSLEHTGSQRRKGDWSKGWPEQVGGELLLTEYTGSVWSHGKGLEIGRGGGCTMF